MKLLIADSEQHTHSLLSKILSSYTSEMHHALAGDEAYVKYHQNSPDLIICSLDLNVFNIFELHKRINIIEKEQVPFLVVGGTTDTHLVRKVIQLGILDFVAKPFDLGTTRYRIGRSIAKVANSKQHSMRLAV